MNKRIVVFFVSLLIFSSLFALPAQAKEGRWRGPCEGWWMGENITPKIFNSDPARGTLMMQRLIVCVFAVWAPGQSAYALAIADRESSFYPWAHNPSGCDGLFQHMDDYWSGRVNAYLWRGWWAPKAKWPVSPFDPRANAIVAAKMVAQSGWGDWGG